MDKRFQILETRKQTGNPTSQAALPTEAPVMGSGAAAGGRSRPVRGCRSLPRVLATVGSKVCNEVSSGFIFSRQFMPLEIAFPPERTQQPPCLLLYEGRDHPDHSEHPAWVFLPPRPHPRRLGCQRGVPAPSPDSPHLSQGTVGDGGQTRVSILPLRAPRFKGTSPQMVPHADR